MQDPGARPLHGFGSDLEGVHGERPASPQNRRQTRHQRRLTGVSPPTRSLERRRRKRRTPNKGSGSLDRDQKADSSSEEDVFLDVGSPDWDNYQESPVFSSTRNSAELTFSYPEQKRHQSAGQHVLLGDTLNKDKELTDIEENPESGASIEAEEKQVSSSGNSPSALTVLEPAMSTDEAKKKYRQVLAQLEMVVEDDILPTQAENVTTEYLQQKVTLAETWKAKAREACGYLGEHDPALYEERFKAAAADHRKAIVSFVTKAQAVLKEREEQRASQPRNVTEAAQAAARKIKAKSVTNYAEAVITGLQELNDEMKLLTLGKPENDSNCRKFVMEATAALKRLDAVEADARNMYQGAVDAGLEEPAGQIEDNMRKARASGSELGDKLISVKQEFNLLTGSSGTRNNSDLIPPTFTGDYQDKTDFFQFKKDFDEYVDVKNPTKDEQLRILLTRCLKGEAKTACQNMTSTKDVFDYLRETFGNVRIMLEKQLEDVKKFSVCAGDDNKRRTWLITAKSKLLYIQDLAGKHGLEEKLYNSGIFDEVRGKLPYKQQDEFIKQLEEYSQGAVMDRSEMYEQLLSYIGSYTTTLTFRINNGIIPIGAEKKAEASAKVVNKPAATKPSGKRSYAVGAPSDGGKNAQKGGNGSGGPSGGGKPRNLNFSPKKAKCRLCGGEHTHLYYCKQFQDTPIADRYKTTAKAAVCMRCLASETEVDFNNRRAWWEEHGQTCYTKWTCKAGGCHDKAKYKQYHFLICVYHKKENEKLETEFIKSLDQKMIDSSTRFFFNAPMLTFHAGKVQYGKPVKGWEILADVTDPAIFQLQYIKVNGIKMLVFFDSGCGAACVSARAAKLLDTEVVRPGPSEITVSGGGTVSIPGGEERFTLPLIDGKRRATITALVMPQVTAPFPIWDLTEATEELYEAWKEDVGTRPMPKPPQMIGGTEIDIMLGIKYLKWFPRILYQLNDGLAIYRTVLMPADDCDGVLGGPHKSWTRYEDLNHLIYRVYSVMPLKPAREDRIECVQEVFHPINNLWRSVVDEIEVEGSLKCSREHCPDHQADVPWPTTWDYDYTYINTLQAPIRDPYQKYWDMEGTAAEIQYRCPNCRNCQACRSGEVLEAVSLKDEKEQFLIENSIRYDAKQRKLIARLPFIANPSENLMPNYNVAMKVFESQMKMANKNENVREGVVKAFKKLADKGFVAVVEDLPEDVRKAVEGEQDHGHFIPWRTVVNDKSISTPIRMVFDASARTPGGTSLNQILAKGQNTLANLFNLIIRFRIKKWGFVSDVQMAYNGLAMDIEHLRYHKFLWKEEMLAENKVQTMVIMTHIYGVKSSGNLTIAGFKLLAERARSEQKDLDEGAEVLESSSYMDDVVYSCDTEEGARVAATKLKEVLKMGSMDVKDITIAGETPSEAVSSDGTHVGLLGMLWDPKRDKIALDIKEMYLGKLKRGKRPEAVVGDLKEALKGKFTKRTLVGKVAGIYDPTGIATPVTAKFKLNLAELNSLKLDWDDKIPIVYLDTWVENLTLMQNLKGIYFNRTVIPEDALNTKISYIVSCDASEKIAIAAVHSRVEKKNGDFYVQLLCAKSRIVRNLTVPRAELKAAVTAAALSFCVRLNSKDAVEDVIYVSNSTICLYWLQQDQRPLQTGVRNGVLEVRRLTDINNWFHVASEDNVADIGTRSGTAEDLRENSDWIRGKPWMSQPRKEMPLRTLQEITLNSEEKKMAAKEMKAQDFHGYVFSTIEDKLAERYSFSKYVLDPNKFKWEKTLRVLALIFRVLDKMRGWTRVWFPEGEEFGNEQGAVRQKELDRAAQYYFTKGTAEVKRFSKPQHYQASKMDNGVLKYVGRIIEGQKVENEIFEGLDVNPMMFVRPILDRYSPVSYAVMVHSHETLAKHGNNALTLRESRAIAFIISGRDLAIEVRERCPWCVRYKAIRLERLMGKLHMNRFAMAPAFYYTQADLFGPIIATCEHNHRSTVKAYGCVFRCTTTGAISIHCMQKYDAPAFLQAFTRFGSRFGVPKKIFIDAGTQLVHAVKNMEISRLDLEGALAREFHVGLEFEVCPTAAHHAQGQVERSIKEVKKFLGMLYKNLKMDLMTLETAFAFISNEMNCLPIGLGSRTDHLGNLDLITPSRLLHGRNNRRSLTGQVLISGTNSRLIKQGKELEEAWWNVWNTQKIANFIPQPPKWAQSRGKISVGDIIVFIKKNPDKVTTEEVWKIGKVKELHEGRDGEVRQVTISYVNASEDVTRETKRDVRHVAVIHHEGDLPLVDVLNRAQKDANREFFMSTAIP